MDVIEKILNFDNYIKSHTYSNGNLYNNKNTTIGKLDASNGYIKVRYKRKTKYLHRMIWEYHNGKIPGNMVIDHIDMDKLNNKIENLRICTKSENACNSNIGKGYYLNSKNQKYYAYINKNGIRFSLGGYSTATEARAAYVSAKKRHHKIGL